MENGAGMCHDMINIVFDLTLNEKCVIAAADFVALLLY